MKRVFIGRGVSEAHLVKAYLESAGISAVVRGEQLSAVFGGIPIDGDSLPSVWVLDEANYDQAVELIRETSKSVEPDETAASDELEGTDWRCPQCGEMVDGPLIVCWHCGAERSAGL